MSEGMALERGQVWESCRSTGETTGRYVLTGLVSHFYGNFAFLRNTDTGGIAMVSQRLLFEGPSRKPHPFWSLTSEPRVDPRELRPAIQEEPVEATVVHDRGSRLIVFPKALPVGQVVRIGEPRSLLARLVRPAEPRSLLARVVRHEDDGLCVCDVLVKCLPRRARWAHDWLPDSLLGPHGPMVDIPKKAAV